LERFYRDCAALRAAQSHFGFNKLGTFIVRDHLSSGKKVAKVNRKEFIKDNNIKNKTHKRD